LYFNGKTESAMKIIPFLITFFILALSNPAFALEVNGLSQPESVVVDPESGDYYISNLNGTPLGKDNNGFITKVNADSLITVLKFIQPKEGGVELHAPKGMVILNNALYVTDIDVIRYFDLETGQVLGKVNFEPLGVEFLNDLTADPQGNIYVSDMNTNRIFRVQTYNKHAIDVFSQGEELGGPNGLFYDNHNRRLIVVTWATGRVLELDDKGKPEILKSGFKTLDGVFIDDAGNLFTSSFAGGEVYKITQRGRGQISSFQNGLVTPADIAYDSRKRSVLVPSMNENKVFSLEND